MLQLAEGFRDALRRYRIAELEEHAGAIYGLTPDFRLAYMNPAWFRFAEVNGGEPRISTEWTLGRSILDCILPPTLRRFYERRLWQSLRSGVMWKHEYECSSATHYRRFHQVVYPLDDGAGLLVVNSLAVEQSHDPAARPAYAPDVATYQDVEGIICQCAHCRRVQHPRERQRWDWIPDWVTTSPQAASHGICPTCYRFQYPAETDA